MKIGLILILEIAILFSSCSKTDSYSIPKGLNMGYLYDSLQYEQEQWMVCGTHYTTNLGAHRMYCSLLEFIPYCNLNYADKELKEVILKEGTPQETWRDTLHYGYIKDNQGEWIFPFVEFYDSEGLGPDSCQAVYRIQNILNHPCCIVQTSIWEDSVRYLRLNSLVKENRNLVFWGLQAQSGFHWPE